MADLAPPRYRGPLARYGTALVAVALATGIRAALSPFVGDRFPFLTFVAALILVGWRAGFGPALLTAVLGGVASGLLFLDWTPRPTGPSARGMLLGYAIV